MVISWTSSLLGQFGRQTSENRVILWSFHTKCTKISSAIYHHQSNETKVCGVQLIEDLKLYDCAIFEPGPSIPPVLLLI